MPQLEDLRQRYILDTSSVKREAKAAQTAIRGLKTEVNKSTVASKRNKAEVKKQTLALRALGGVAREVQSAYRLALRRAGAAAVVGLVLALGKATAAAAKFQKGIAEVSTLVDTATVSMHELNLSIKGIAKSIPVGIDDLTKALYQTISASIPAARAIEFLGVAAKAAVAGVTSTEVAVDGMTTVLNAWGKDVSASTSIADTFFITIRNGKTTFEELSKNIGTVAPNAAALGITFEEVSSAIAAMTLQGLSTDKATVSLRGFFAAILNPGKQAIDTANSLGLEWGEQAIKAKGLAKFLEDLRKATLGNTSALAKLVPNVRALTGVNAILGEGYEDLNRLLDDTENKIGELDKAYGKMRRTTDAVWSLLKNQLGVIMIRLGENILPKVSDSVQGLIDTLDRMASPGNAAVSILERMGEKAKTASYQMKELSKLQRLNTIEKILSRGAPVGRITGVQGPQAPPLADPFMSKLFGFLFSGPSATTTDRAPFAKMEEVLERQQQNLSEAGSLRDRILEIGARAADQQREFTKEERKEIDILFDQIDALELHNEALENYIDTLNEREKILKSMTSGPNFLGVGPLSMHKPTDGKETPVPTEEETDAQTSAREKAIDQLKKIRDQLELIAAPNEEIRDLLEQRQRIQERINQLNEIAAELGPEAVENETRAFRELLNAINDTIEARQKDPVMDVGGISPLAARMPTGFDKIAEEAKEWREETEATERSTLHLRTISFQVANAITKAVERLDKAGDETDDWKEGLQEAQEAVAAIARALRDLDMPELASLIEGVSGISVGVESFRNATSFAGQLTAGAGIVGALAGLASALISNEEEQRRLRDSFNDARRSIEKYSEALLARDIIGSDLTEDQISLARNAGAGLPTAGFDTGRDIIRNLIDQGVISEALGEAYLEMLKSFDLESPGGRADDALWQAFLEESGILGALDDVATRAGEFGDSLDGARKAAELAGTFGTEQDQLNAFLDQLLKLDIGDELRGQIEGGFDLSTDAGRAALRAFVEALVASLIAGDERFLGGQLTSDDIDDLKDFLVEFIPDEGSLDGISRSVQIQRTITEIQANELIAIQESALLTLERILDAIGMGQSEGNTYQISISIPPDATDFGRRILEEIEQEIRLKEAS